MSGINNVPLSGEKISYPAAVEVSKGSRAAATPVSSSNGPSEDAMPHPDLMKAKERCQAVVDPRPFEYALSLVGGKWKLHILFWIWRREVMRYGELKRSLGGITHKMLSHQLKELEVARLVIRHEYPQVPPKVEYRLSKRGETLMPVMHELCLWGQLHMNDASA